jgi:sugar-specific transcriptional regulator TrmB
MLREEDIEALVALKLTILQAKVYLATAMLKEAKMSAISKTVGVARQDIYRVIAELQQRGLVEKVIDRPVRFKALPVHEAIPILLSRLHEERMEAHNKAMELMERHKRYRKSGREFEEDQVKFLLIPEKNALARGIEEMVEAAQESIDIATSNRECVRASFDFSQSFRKALDKGVKIRWIMKEPLTINNGFRVSKVLSENSLFELRNVRHGLTQTFHVYDKKILIIVSNPKLGHLRSPALFTNATPLVELAQHRFESMWNQLPNPNQATQ